MDQIIDLMDAAAEDKSRALVRRRDEGLAPDPELLAAVRAKYLLGLRERLQKDPSIRAVVTASVPATEAHSFVESKAWDLVREGTEDVYRDAIMYLLAELEELRKAGDQAYIVDTSTGEIVAPLTPDALFYPDPYEEERTLQTGEIERFTVTPKPILDPKISLAVISRAAASHRETEVRRRAADTVTGRSYLHLTDPQRIVELAKKRLAESGLREREKESMEGCDPVPVEFGQETNEADMQSNNPFYHRLWSYSAILASRVMQLAGTGGEFWMSEVRGNRDEEVRWYAVTVLVRRAS